MFLILIAFCSGCRTLHSDLDRAVFDQRVQERFPLGMSKAGAWDQLERLSIEPYDYGEQDEDIITWVKPRKSIVFGGFFDYYGRKRMYLYFGSDDALDRITFEPTGEESLYEIELVHLEVTP
jgi:hypothetical protein